MPLVWMAEQVEHELRFQLGQIKHFRAYQSAIGPMHDSRSGASVMYRYGPRPIGVSEKTDGGPPVVHLSEVERMLYGCDDYAPVMLPASWHGKTHTMAAIPYLAYVSASAQTSAELRAPMTGSVLKINVAPGDQVKAGDVAIVMESMKMELRIVSEIDGIVATIRCRPGETVARNAIVAVIGPH